MTEVDDLTRDNGSAGEAVDPREPEKAPSSDPLDDIKDETARAEAKKHRAIARRHGEKSPEEPAHSDKSLKLVVTNQAKSLVSEEIRNNWDELMKIDLRGYDEMDAYSIAANMAERYIIHQGKTKGSDGKTQLIATKGAGTPGTKDGTKKSIPRPTTFEETISKTYGA